MEVGTAYPMRLLLWFYSTRGLPDGIPTARRLVIEVLFGNDRVEVVGRTLLC